MTTFAYRSSCYLFFIRDAPSLFFVPLKLWHSSSRNASPEYQWTAAVFCLKHNLQIFQHISNPLIVIRGSAFMVRIPLQNIACWRAKGAKEYVFLSNIDKTRNAEKNTFLEHIKLSLKLSNKNHRLMLNDSKFSSVGFLLGYCHL